MADSIPTINDRAAAEAFLDERIGQGVKPGLERIAGVLEFMGNPQFDYPVIHVAGTNGKTTVTRLVADILGAGCSSASPKADDPVAQQPAGEQPGDPWPQELEKKGWRVLVIWECEIKTNEKLETIIKDFLQ